MTQGYGPGNGQQDQWGQQQPQWGQEPQWGQVSPAPAPGGYPGGSGYPGTSGFQSGGGFAAPGDGVNWRRVKMLGMALLVSAGLLLLIRMSYAIAAFISAPELASSNEELSGLGLGMGLLSLVLMGANALVGTVVLVLGLVLAFTARERARLGGIIAAASIPLSIITYWIVAIVSAFLLIALGFANEAGEVTTGGYRITYVIDALRNLLIIGAVGLGGYFAFSTAAAKLRG